MAARVLMETFFAYWNSWYMLPSGLEDSLNLFVFSLAILIGVQLALARSTPDICSLSWMSLSTTWFDLWENMMWSHTLTRASSRFLCGSDYLD